MNVAILLAVGRRPDLWRTALRQLRRTAPDRWWRRWPPLPLPSRHYLEFRMVTQYGKTHGPPDPDDVVDYLAWCREWERSSGQ